MNDVIMFTPNQLIQFVILICTCITGVSGVIAIIVAIVKKIKSPNDVQNERLDLIEKRLNKQDERLADDDTRLDKIESGFRVTQRALLALLSHGIDGNEIDGMRDAKKELTNYLIKS